MKKILTVVAIGLALSLGACGVTDTQPAPKETVSTPAPTPTPEPDPESSYLDSVYGGTEFSGSDADALDLGFTFCEATEEIGVSGTFLLLVDIAIELEYSAAEAEDFGYIYASAIIHLCPQYTEELEKFIDTVEQGDTA